MNRVMPIALVLACGSFAARADDVVIKPRVKIDQAVKAMADAGYQEAVLAQETDPAHELKMWDVGDGVLICRFARRDRQVTTISYFLCDERPKSTRKEFEFPVHEFHPQTRQMHILLPKQP